MKNPLTFVLIFSGTWLLVGTVFFVIGIALLRNRRKKELNCTSRTYGRVVDMVMRQSHDSDGGYHSSLHPVFEYTVGALTYVKESSYGSSNPKFAIGQTVEVCYDPRNCHDYYIAGETLPKTLAKIFIAVGAAAMAVAVISAALILYFQPVIH